MHTSKKPLALALCLALLIVSSFYLILTTAGDGDPAIVEADQVLYLQYARNIALGHPYVFSPGDTPSTGSTTHLYPFILAAIYKLGATGNSFITATYALNGLCYLGIVALAWLIAKKMSRHIASLAAFMVALSGHTVSAVLHQTDIGFFTFLALALFASILHSRFWLTLILAILCGITRPEGLIFSIAFLLSGITGIILNRRFLNAPGTSRQAGQFLIFGFAGALAFGGTLFINHLLTGYAQFMSVSNKGYFNAFPMVGALQHTLYDTLSIIKGVFFGLPDTARQSRQFYLFPLIGGALALTGIMLYPRKDKQRRLCECWLILSGGAVLLTVASSQWQGISNDRYLAWIFPVWIIYALIGAAELHERVNVKLFLPMTAALLILFQVISLVFIMADSYTSSVMLEKKKSFAISASKEIPSTERLGSVIGAGMSFFMPQHKVYNLTGITSPDFFKQKFDTQILSIIDQLKHQPELRFEYWLSYHDFLDSNPWAAPFIGDLKLLDTDAAITGSLIHGIYLANWETLDGGETPQLISSEIEQLTLVDALDIGYYDDEIHHNYDHYLRLKHTYIPLAIMTAKLGTNDYSEVGRIILGSESFTVREVSPKKPLKVIFRTAKTVEGHCYFSTQLAKINTLGLVDDLSLRLFVDDQEIPCPSLDISSDGFSEVVFDIPAVYLQNSTPLIKIVGDHISFAYWFYQ